MKSSISLIPAGIVSFIGNDLQTISRNLKNGNTAPFPHLPLSVDGIMGNRPYALLDTPLQHIQHKENLMIEQVSLTLDAHIPDLSIRKNTPFLVGSTGLNISDTPQDTTAHTVQTSLNSCAQNIADQTKLNSMPVTITTACTSSAAAIILASRLLNSNDVQCAVSCGFDWYSKQIFYGFESLKLLSHTTCRPFDCNRDGIVLGEGAASVIVSRQHNSPVKLRGVSLLLDTYDQTTHEPNGLTIAQCMEEALTDAKMNASDIDSIKAHGTGSAANDRAESAAIRKVFNSKIPPVIALKPYIGHTLGACGVVELLIHMATLGAGFLPGISTFNTLDPECNIALLKENQEISFPHTSMLCSFGFGGSCAVLIITIERPIQW